MTQPTVKQIDEIIDYAVGSVDYDDGREFERAIKLTWQKAQDEILQEVVHFIVDNQENKECNYIIEFIGRLHEVARRTKNE
jgi:hypothetical protein